MYSIQKAKENSVPKPAVEVKPPEPIVTTTASTTGGGAINQQQPSTYTGQFSSGVPYGMQQQQNQSPFSQRIAASNAANQQITGQNQFSMPNTNGLTFGGGY
jgi:capsule polysaccharide modification protein KpsS